MKQQKINKYIFLGELFNELKSNEFVLQISDYNDLFELVKEEENLENIKLTLAPVICTNPEQQSEFYKLFDLVKSKQKITTENKPNQLCDFLIYLLFFDLLLVFSLIINYFQPETKIRYNPDDFIIAVDSSFVEFTTQKFFKNNPSLNKKNVTFHVTIDKSTYKGFYKKFQFDDLKEHKFEIKIESHNDDIDTTLQHTYQSLPYLANDFQLKENDLFQKNSEQAILESNIGDTVYFSIKTNKNFQDSVFIYIDTLKRNVEIDKFEDISLIEKKDFKNCPIVAFGPNTILYKHIFKKEGRYVFKGLVNKAVEVNDTIKYASTQKMIVDVLPENRLEIVPVDKEIIQTSYTNMQWIIACILLSILLLTLVWLNHKKNNTNKKITLHDETSLDFSGNNPPFNLNFKNKNHTIKKDIKLKTWINELFINANTYRYDVNIEKTISKTISNFGYITPVYQQTLRPKRYTVLVHKKFAKSTQFFLFNYLIEQFKTNNIPLDYFYFKDFTSIYDLNDQPVTINEIIERYSQNTFIFFSDGYHFINYQTNDINTLEKKVFSLVENKIVVSPVPYLDWGAEEKIIKNYLPLVPADFIGLLHIIQIINSEQKFSNLSTYHSKYINFLSVDELKNFTQETDLFQWICALAIYPKIQWELIISIGNHLFPEKVTYSNLLKITRIKWLNEASFPVDLRLELLKELTVENEIKAREFILKLFETEFLNVSKDEFIYQEIETQKQINSFIVFANNTSKTQYLKEAERYIIQSKNGTIIDTALLEYLKNDANDSTEHPLQKEDYSNSEQFIQKHDENKLKEIEEEQKAQRKKRTKRIVNSFLAMLPLFLICTLFLMSYNPKYDSILKKIHFIELIETVPDNDQITFTFNYIDCFKKTDSLFYNFHTLESTPKNGNSKFEWFTNSVITLNKSNFQKDTFYTFSVSNLKNDENFDYSGNFNFNPEKNYTITPLCKTPDATKVYIQYYPNNNQKKANDFINQTNKLNVFKFQALDFNGNKINGVRYFKDTDKNKAEYLANLASVYFGFNIKAMKSKAKLEKNKYSHIELWINDTNTCKAFKEGEKYTLFSEKDKSKLTDESIKMLEEKLEESNGYTISMHISSSSSRKESDFYVYVFNYIQNYATKNKIACDAKILKGLENKKNTSYACGIPVQLIFEKKPDVPNPDDPIPNYLVVKIATAEIGYTENPIGSNKTKYGEWFGANGNPWSAIFVNWVYDQAGKPIQKGTKGFGAFFQLNNYAIENKLTTSNPVLGDIYTVKYDDKGSGHGGIFLGWIDANKTQFEVIEGNTIDKNEVGKDAYKVAKRTRTVSPDITFIHIK